MQLLITGSSGYIGSHLTKSLFLDDPFPLTPSSEELDITNWFLINKYFERHRPDVVVHLAAQAAVGPSIKNPSIDLDINCNGMINLSRAAAKYGTTKFVYSSTCAVYGDCMFLTETDTLSPKSPYGVSKLAAENYLSLAEIPIKTKLRLSNVYGYRDNHIVDVLSGCLETKEGPVFFGTGRDTYRDYIHVRDVVNAIKMMIFKDYPGTYNVCTGVPTNLSTLWSMIQEVWCIDGEPVDYKPAREFDAKWAVPSAEKLQNVCGFKYLYPDMISGLRQVFYEGKNEKGGNN
tara:strand:+ start:32214 stop:33080 length:867 start_codon:yes stop_codon:yes gene_type:complete